MYPDVAKDWKLGIAFDHWSSLGKIEGRKYECNCDDVTSCCEGLVCDNDSNACVTTTTDNTNSPTIIMIDTIITNPPTITATEYITTSPTAGDCITSIDNGDFESGDSNNCTLYIDFVSCVCFSWICIY